MKKILFIIFLSLFTTFPNLSVFAIDLSALKILLDL